MRNKRVALASLFVVAGAFAFGVASAQTSTPPIALTWNAPAGCSDSATILKEVTKLRGDVAATEQMTAIATVALDANGIWSLQITTNFADGTHGDRQIQAESCKAAADATASILALALTNRAQEIAASAPTTTTTTNAANAIDASTSVAPPPASSSSSSADQDAGPAVVPPSPSGEYQPRPFFEPTERELLVIVGGQFGFTTGDLPSIGFGGGGAIGIEYWRLRVEALVEYYAFARAHFGDANGTANFQTFSVGARGCWTFVDKFMLGPCLDLQLASLAGESFNVSTPSSGSALVPEGFLGAMAAIPLGKRRGFALRALLEVGAPSSRPQFVLDGVGFVHQPAPIIGRGTIGAEFRF